MPGKRTRRITEEFEDENRIKSESDFKVDDPAEVEYENLLAKEGAEGCVIKLYRQNPNGSGREYLLQGAPSEITEEYIRLYHAQQVNAHESTIYFRNVEVHGVLRQSFPTRIGPQVSTPGSAPSIHSNNGSDMMVRVLQQQNEMFQRLLLEKSNHRGESITDLAQALQTLDQMRGPRQETPSELIMKAIELGAKMNNGGGDHEGWQPMLMEVLKSAGPLIGQIVGGIAAKNGGPPVVQSAIPAQGVQQVSEEENKVLLMDAVTFLKQKCLRNSDPQLYVAVICDNAESAPYDQLVSRITREEFSFFETIDAEIGKPPFRAFFEFIYNGVRSWANEANPVDDDSKRENGDVADPPKDARPVRKRSRKS